MAVRQISWKKWLKQITSTPLGDGSDHLVGLPIADVEKRLHVSRQRVHQLIEADRLEALQILTGKGNVAATIVTEASLEAYEPRPTGRPLQLAFPE